MPAKTVKLVRRHGCGQAGEWAGKSQIENEIAHTVPGDWTINPPVNEVRSDFAQDAQEDETWSIGYPDLGSCMPSIQIVQ